jgi:hypothetical protein
LAALFYSKSSHLKAHNNINLKRDINSLDKRFERLGILDEVNYWSTQKITEFDQNCYLWFFLFNQLFRFSEEINFAFFYMI